VWNMTLKQGLAGAIAAAVSGYVVGAAVAMLFARSGREVATVTSTKPTAG
jgi:hypothetical protein